ncbi:hypothetical protein [Kitasatospora aureofaciens]|uniref:hypothetical protein n=1 Tax=Kitasatospora aureofaciens TaxID=1894 RepID=UPI0036F494FC
MRNFTVLPNGLLQDRRLSYTARGLLADLLSRPDGWREDGRHMADTSPQGRGAIRKALKELADAGYYRVEKIRMPDGTIITETHVYDAPQVAQPGATRPLPGRATTGDTDALIKDQAKGTSLPTEQTHRPQARAGGRKDDAEQEPVAEPDDHSATAWSTRCRLSGLPHGHRPGTRSAPSATTP